MSFEDDTINMLEYVSKSVVHINTVQVVRDYYNRRMPLKGSGSGFILEANGHIVTNAHVVRQAGKIGVVLWDNKLVEGVILGSCRSIDIALVKIDSEDLLVAQLGDSDKIRDGQSVYAIGNPFGLEGGPTVTRGVISALDRSIQSREASLTGLVQTDASINPGNSGGPLVDTKGRVIAINTAIIPYAQGIGFAIPINTVMDCVEQIKTHGKGMSPWIGIYGVTVTPQVASYYNLGVQSGVLITNVVPGSPAQKASIASGDVIIAVNEASVKTIQGLKAEIDKRKIGDRARFTLARGSQRGTVELLIEGSP
jgi:S1-C subfamily serine protease